MVALVGEITRREDAPASFHARFWRDFYRSMLTNTVRSAMAKFFIMAIVIGMASAAHAVTPQPLNLVIALDLTKSTDVKGPDGKTEFQKNVEGVTGLLAQMPSGSHVTVIGITDRSFAQPYILLSAGVPDDPGYFGERLTDARRQLMQAWVQRSKKLTPNFNGTDILGALELAGHLFGAEVPSARRNVLVIFSDMRNHTSELDLESATGSAPVSNTPLCGQGLKDAHVFALGVDGAGQTTKTWLRTEAYWNIYLAQCGAKIEELSPLRQMIIVANR